MTNEVMHADTSKIEHTANTVGRIKDSSDSVVFIVRGIGTVDVSFLQMNFRRYQFKFKGINGPLHVCFQTNFRIKS